MFVQSPQHTSIVRSHLVNSQVRAPLTTSPQAEPPVQHTMSVTPQMVQSIIDDYMHTALLSSSTGRRQLPAISDRPNLPYIEAMVYEILRWNPSVPLGLPHVVTQDDV